MMITTMSTTHILLLLLFASSVSALPCIDPQPQDGGNATLIKCARNNSLPHNCALYKRKVGESREVFVASTIKYSGQPDADVGGNFSCYTTVNISFAESKKYAFRMLINNEFFVAGCPNGTYGNVCSKRCHCIGRTCVKENGTCPGSCAPGYNHPSCSNQAAPSDTTATHQTWVYVVGGVLAMLVMMLVSAGVYVVYTWGGEDNTYAIRLREVRERRGNTGSILKKRPDSDDNDSTVVTESKKETEASSTTVWSSDDST